MKKIRLKGNLNPELKRLGLKPGNIVLADPCAESEFGAMRFEVSFTIRQHCMVWPENYDELSMKAEEKG